MDRPTDREPSSVRSIRIRVLIDEFCFFLLFFSLFHGTTAAPFIHPFLHPPREKKSPPEKEKKRKPW
jgi:hypothetical protein